jgi:hypothetical protein
MEVRFARTTLGALPPLPVRDPGGAFTIDGLEGGRYELRVTSPEGGVATEQVELASGERKTGLRIALVPGARLVGKVVTLPGGVPVGGAQVSTNTAGRLIAQVAAPDGTFELAGLAPTDELALRVRAANAPNLVPEQVDVAVPAGGTVDLGTIRLLEVQGAWYERLRDTVPPGILVDGHGVATGIRRDSGAAKAGIARGDRILAVDGRDVTGFGSGALMHLLRGPRQSTTALTVQTPGEPPRTVTVVRE